MEEKGRYVCIPSECYRLCINQTHTRPSHTAFSLTFASFTCLVAVVIADREQLLEQNPNLVPIDQIQTKEKS